MAIRTLHSSAEAIRISQDADQPIEHRVEKIRLLGKRRAREAVPALVRLLDEGPDEIRSASGRALESIQSRTATRALIRILKRHPSFVAREWAAMILFMLGDRRAANVLAQVLTDKTEGEYLRGRAAQALGMIHPASRRTLQPLISALGDTSAEVRYSTICALSATQGTRAIAAAIAALEKLTQDLTELPNEGSVGKLAAEVLRVLRDREK